MHSQVQGLKVGRFQARVKLAPPYHCGHGCSEGIRQPAPRAADVVVFAVVVAAAAATGDCQLPLHAEVYVGSVGHGVQWDAVN